MKLSSFLKALQVHDSWMDFFDHPSIQQLLIDIEKQVGKEITPAPERVLRFAETDLKKMKCVVWGRDPYPQIIEKGEKKGERVATGRSFEVNGATSWDDKSINASLRNILKLLHKSYFRLDQSVSIQEVRKAIKNRTFPILPPHQAFDEWEKNGVLFLNRSLTCKVGNQKNASGSHERIWKPFLEKMLPYMVQENPHMKHFLWGTAKELAPTLITLGVKPDLLYISKHPSAYVGDTGGFDRDGNFLVSPCFLDTMNELRWVE